MTGRNRNIIRDEIRGLLEAINEQFDMLRKYEEQIPRIEFDIILENIRKLYDDLNLLYRLGDREHPGDSLSRVPDAVPPSVPAGEPGQVAVPEKKETGTGKEEAENPVPGPNLFSGSGSEFGEKLREVREKTIGPVLNQKKPDLKSLISINDKFLFINELFDGNLREYNDAVSAIATCRDKAEAMEIVDRLRMNNRWDSEKPAFKKLTEMVRKLYG